MKRTIWIARKGTISGMREKNYMKCELSYAVYNALNAYKHDCYSKSIIVKTSVGCAYVHYKINKVSSANTVMLQIQRIKSNGDLYGDSRFIPFTSAAQVEFAYKAILYAIVRDYGEETPTAYNHYLEEDATCLMTIEFYDELSYEDKKAIGVFY